MPIVSTFEIFSKREQPVIYIRKRVNAADISQFMQDCYFELFTFLGKNGFGVADMPYAAYYNMDMEDLDVEMGVPVTEEIEVRGDIKYRVQNLGKVVTCIYRGAYSETFAAYNELKAWMTEKGFEQSAESYEVYLNSPQGVCEDELLTMIVVPMKE